MDRHVTPPAWVGGTDRGEVVPTANGLLGMRTRELHDHTPDFFSQHVLPFGYDPNAPPKQWLAFLEELWF
jgi:phage/plasmid-associated DNA primase